MLNKKVSVFFIIFSNFVSPSQSFDMIDVQNIETLNRESTPFETKFSSGNVNSYNFDGFYKNHIDKTDSMDEVCILSSVQRLQAKNSPK